MCLFTAVLPSVSDPIGLLHGHQWRAIFNVNFTSSPTRSGGRCRRLAPGIFPSPSVPSLSASVVPFFSAVVTFLTWIDILTVWICIVHFEKCSFPNYSTGLRHVLMELWTRIALNFCKYLELESLNLMSYVFIWPFRPGIENVSETESWSRSVWFNIPQPFSSYMASDIFPPSRKLKRDQNH